MGRSKRRRRRPAGNSMRPRSVMWVNRKKTLTLFALAIVVVGAAASGGSAAKTNLPTRRRTDTHLDVLGTEIGLRRARADRPVAARSDRLEARERDDQVRLRRDRVVRRRCRGSRRDEPVGHRQAARPERRRRRGLRPARSIRSRARSARRRQGGAGCQIRQTYTTAYGGVEAQVPANQIVDACSTCRASPRCRRTRSSSRWTTTRRFIGATDRLAAARRARPTPART